MRPKEGDRNFTQYRERGDLARDLRRNQTAFERLLWCYLRGRRLAGVKFRRQHPIGPYIADFCSLERRIIIEVDGPYHEKTEKADFERTEFLKNQGFRVIRFHNTEVLNHPDRVLDQIRNLLHL